MIKEGDSVCPGCGGELRYYGLVNRILRGKNGIVSYTQIRRLRCANCRSVHRELPDYIFPFKHYKAEIIIGVLDGSITPETLDYEDFPCEMTMNRWIARKLQLLLWKTNS